jgi:ubiquinone/menaquinone biosynthesis C-methylase UbiE
MKNVFDSRAEQYDSWYDKNRYAYLSELAAVKKVVPKKGKGLEIGSGTGRFAGPLGIKCAIEPSESMRKIAQSRGVYAIPGYGEELLLKDSYFDYAALIVTICFVKDPQKVVLETRRVLKSGGRIIIGIVDGNSFLGRYYRGKKSIFYRSARFFSVPEIIAMLKKTSFDKFKIVQTMFKKPHEIHSVEKPIKGYGKGGFVVVCARKKEE